MIITDKLLEKVENSKKPIRVGIIGTGFMGSAIVAQIEKFNKGMTVVAACNRTIVSAQKAFKTLGISKITYSQTQQKLDVAISHGYKAITDKPELLCKSKLIVSPASHSWKS